MKSAARTVLVTILSVLGGGEIAKAASVTVGSASTSVGGTASVPLVYSGSGSRVAAVGFSVVFPAVNVSRIDPLASAGAVAAGKSVSCTNSGPGRLKCIVFGVNDAPLTDGPLVQLTVGIASNASPGAVSVGLTEVAAATTTGGTEPLAASGGTITVLAPVSVPPTPTLTSFSCTPSALTVGASSTCSVALSQAAPGSGIVVGVGSTTAQAITLTTPSAVTVPGGGLSATFQVRVESASSNGTVSMSASTTAADRKTFTLSVTGSAAPPPAQTGCTYSALPPAPAPAEGKMLDTMFTASSPSCSWTARSNADWAQVQALTGAGSARIYINVFPNFSTLPRSAVITVGGLALTVQQSGSPAARNERLVRLFYHSFLGRTPSPEEAAFQVRALDAGGSPAVMADSFVNSMEFNSGGRFVAGLYVGLLGRDAEYSGWLFQRDALSRGVTNGSIIVESFLNSPEWKLRHGSAADIDFIRLLYRQILLREPSAEEIAFQARVLQSRATMAANFLNSGEFRTGSGQRLTVFLLYACLLARAPSPEEAAFWRERLSAGMSTGQLIDSFLSSPEMALRIR